MTSDNAVPRSDQKRVYLHIGAPKTGTTYLQQVLLANADRLATQGVLYPYSDSGQSFRSAHAFCGTTWFGHPPDTFIDDWEVVAERARTWQGSRVILSSELLAGAPRNRIDKGIGLLGPAEIHVIFSARDLARQLVADWQEHIKHRHTVTLETFVDDLVELGPEAPEPFGTMFWGLQDAVRVLETWVEFVPRDRIHVITVPQPGGPSDALWNRFCDVTGLDPRGYDTEARRTNQSMGVYETELVRRMNFGVTKLPVSGYDSLVRLFLAEKVLGGGSTRLTLPPNHVDWAKKRSRTLIDKLAEADYQVAGDLEDLMPSDPVTPYVSPTALTDADLGPLAVKAATALLNQAGRLRAKNVLLREELAGRTTAGRLDRLNPRRLAGRARQRVRRAAHLATRKA